MTLPFLEYENTNSFFVIKPNMTRDTYFSNELEKNYLGFLISKIKANFEIYFTSKSFHIRNNSGAIKTDAVNDVRKH